MKVTEEMWGIMSRHGPAPLLETLIPLLAERKSEYDTEQELWEAGEFVAIFGTLWDLFDVADQPSLHDMQHLDTDDESAWGLLGHWSIERGDGEQAQPTDFKEHLAQCRTCTYLEEVVAIVDGFNRGDCPECRGELGDHAVGPDADGTPRAWCKETWQREQPLVGNGGDPGGDRQVSEAFDARWTAKLADGTIAMITRSWYVAEDDGENYIECQTEYLHCSDQRAPGDTEIHSDYLYEWVDADEPTAVVARQLTEDAEVPEPGEWGRHIPHTPDFAIVGAPK